MPDVTNFPKQGDDKPVSLRNSGYARFDLSYAAAIKSDYPDIWSAGGNIKGNAQFEILSRVARQGGKPATRAEEKAVRLREAWAARHYQDHRLPGVVAQMKWLVVGTLGEQRMKDLMNAEKAKANDEQRAAASGRGAAGDTARDPAGGDDDAAPDGMLVRTAVVRAVRREARPTEQNPQRELVVVEAVAGTEDIDSHDSILACDWDQDGRLSRYLSNPVLQWMHGRDPAQRPAIGNGEKVRCEPTRKRRAYQEPPTTGRDLLFTAVFDDTSEFDREIAAKYEKGVLRAFSVGFSSGDAELRIIDGREIVVFSKNELREISAVNVPSNPFALATKQRALVGAIRDIAREHGGRVNVRDALTQIRSRAMSRAAVAFHAYPPDDDAVWDGDAAEKRVRAWATGADGKVDFRKYREAFAYVDASAPEAFGSYKLIHHDVRDGKLVTSRRGTMAAGAAMRGSRGGVKIPDSDVPAVESHLAKHYAQFELQAPWEKEKAARGPGDIMNTKPKIQIEERAIVDERAAKGTVTCDVMCPHCDKTFEMAMKMAPMSPEKAAEFEQTRASLGEKERELASEQSRANKLEERLATTNSRYTALLLDSAFSELTARSGKKFEPHELDDEKDLARMFLADAAPDPDSPKDERGQPTRTMGQKKLAHRLANLDKRHDLAILDSPITTTGTPLTALDEKTRAAAEGAPMSSSPTTGMTHAGDGFAALLTSRAA